MITSSPPPCRHFLILKNGERQIQVQIPEVFLDTPVKMIRRLGTKVDGTPLFVLVWDQRDGSAPMVELPAGFESNAGWKVAGFFDEDLTGMSIKVSS